MCNQINSHQYLLTDYLIKTNSLTSKSFYLNIKSVAVSREREEIWRKVLPLVKNEFFCIFLIHIVMNKTTIKPI